ncbi:RAVE protein 1 C terminal [Leishmania donovani]|uniref:RAVE_protein_1_C_terminal_putative/Pfam:PF12234 n=1 Tax=Leishmania donovani TaxID=5661 RepID=A0A6J8F5X8_LEIDO|nr:RAVE protein 1 C terminal [Leishmania donovani]VDZ42173.1 RAVE_protein_1_C_terminal_putative/Pfam:PF12234 [Leishmania donovani]
MSSSPSSSPPQEPPRVLFPQECSHDTHCMSHTGNLYTALITGGSRLVLLKNGVVLAQSCPLFDEAPTVAAAETAVSTAPPTTEAAATTTSRGATACTRGESARALPASASRVCAVSVYHFTDDVLRVAVATTTDVVLFEFDDAGQLWRDTRASSFWRTAEGANTVHGSGIPPPSSAAASPGKDGSSTSRCTSMQGRSNLFQTSNASSSSAAAKGSGPITSGGQPTQRQCGFTGRLRWRHVTFRLGATLLATRPGLTEDGNTSSSSTAPYPGAAPTAADVRLRGASAAAAAVPVRISTPAHPSVVRAVDFVSADTLCIVLDTEAVLIVLGNSHGAPALPSVVGSAAAAVQLPDRVVWRSMGAYRSLAVCRVNHHVALALGHATMVVFPSCVFPADDQVPMSSPASPSVVDERCFSRVASTAAPSLFSTNSASGGAHVTATVGSRDFAVAPTPAFSPTSRPTLVGGFAETPGQPTTTSGASASPAAGAYTTLAERALTTSVGIYHITDMQWHCVSSHTLLCVTCTHPQEETAYMMLYTVQSLSSVRRYTNVMREHADGGWGPCRGGYEGEELDIADASLRLSGRSVKNIVQLVPAGVIALAYTPSLRMAGQHAYPCTNGNTAFLVGNATSPASTADTPLHPPSLQPETPDVAALSVSTVAGTTWGGAPPPPIAEMHTSLVPNFSHSAEANSMSSRMEFVHVEGDGTVRTSSYAFGRQKHASFAKQRAVGLACRELLQPLLRLYGSLVKVTVLPPWRTRPIELGHDTSKQPCAVELMLGAARRYRMVLRFTSGVVLAVMVDLSAAVYRVECFLALGCAPLLSLRTVMPLAEAEKAQGQPPPPSSVWNPAGSSTILIAGLLGFPTPALLIPSETPLSLPKAPASFLEGGEEGAEDLGAVQRAGGSISADSAAVTRTASATSSHNAAHDASNSVAAAMPPRTVWAVVLLQVEPSGMQARVLTAAPLTEVHIPGVSLMAGAHDGGGGGGGAQSARPPPSAPTAASAGSMSARDAPPMPLTAASTAAAAGCAAQVTEDDVVSFMTLKCPEKLRFMPALLKAAQQDAGRLMAQLIAKYGTAEESGEAVGVAQASEKEARADDGEVEAVPVMSRSHPVVRSLSVLTSGCIGAGGEVLLLVRANALCGGNSEGGEGGGAAALIRLRPPCLEALAPVHHLVAAGGCYIPFEPIVAEYVPVLAEVQQRWWSEPLRPAQLSSTCGATSPRHLEGSVQDVREALRACQRVSAAAEGAAVVQCQVVPRSPGIAYVRVRTPLSPDTGEADAPTALQCLSLPSTIDPKSITRVIGALLVNNDVVIGVLCRTAGDSNAASSVLYLYGCPAVQSLAAPGAAAAAATAKPSDNAGMAATCLASGSSAFTLEATLPGVDAFDLSASGEAVLLRRWPAQVGMPPPSAESAAVQGSRFERWLRCFPKESDSGYSYVQDCTWCPPCGTTGGLLGIGGRGSAVAPETVTALMTLDVAGAWEANTVGLSVAEAARLGRSRTSTCHVLYATTSNSFIHVRQLPLRSSGAAASASGSSSASVVGEAALPQYHPDAVMQLIGMARWNALAKVLTCVADAVRAVVAPVGADGAASTVDESSSVMLFDQPPEELARRLCTSAVARDFHGRPQVAQEEEVLRRVTPPQLSVAALRDEEMQANAMAPAPSSSAPCTTAAVRLYDFSAICGALVSELTQLLPQVTLSGLDSQEHLKLLCILQALRDTLPLSRSVDEAAARHLFYSRYMGLGRRLRLTNVDAPAAAATDSCAPINSVLHFEVDRTATSTVTTASYLWAAMSDSQSTLLSLLFDKASTVYVDGSAGGALGASGGGGGGTGAALAPITGGASAQDLTWEQVKQSGVAFWLRSAADLRAMADRVARHQYQSTKELTDCALMYCTARKAGTLAALAKAQNNQRLHAFFSRDFANNEHNRAAAAANAYAAISKNMPQYGAAFFLLAGDVRSAVQVLLQRCRNPSLALFVLRAAGDGLEEQPSAAETTLEWYIAQRTAEAEVCGALDMWELTCLSWLDVSPPRVSPEVAVQRRVRALQRIAAHPTAHPEALCALRYARDCVAALAYRGDQFLSPAREVVLLLRLGRYCLAHRLSLNGYLHYHDAEALLRGLRAEAAAAACSGTLQRTSNGGDKSRRAPPQTPKMAADFNTGTLLFRGFDGSDDDDEGGSDDGGAFAHARQGSSSSAVGVSSADASSPLFTLSDGAAAAVEAEVQYVYARTGAIVRPGSDAASSAGATAHAGECEDILRRMLLSFTTASPFMMTSNVAAADGGSRAAETVLMPSLAMLPLSSEPSSVRANPHAPFQQLLTSLLHRLSAVEVNAQQERRATAGKPSVSNGAASGIANVAQGCSPVVVLPQMQPAGTSLSSAVAAAVPSLSIATPTAADGGWHALCVPLLHFLLSSVALHCANYIVLLALQRVPVSTEGVLKAAMQAKLLSDDGDALQGAGDTPPPAADAATVAPPLAAPLSPLHRPLIAFFHLLLHHMRRHYRDAWAADGGRLGGGQASTSPSHHLEACGGKGCVWGVTNDDDTEVMAEEDGAMRGGSEDGGQVYRSMFDALLAAATAAEESNNCATRVVRTSCSAGTNWSSFRARADADGATIDADAPGDSMPLHLADSAQVSLLLSCCQAQLHLRLMEHLKQLTRAELDSEVITPTAQRAMDAGILYADALSLEAKAALVQRRILHCTLLLDVTSRWSTLSEECMMRIYAAQPQYAPGPLTDPNGVFLEVQQTVRLMHAVLVAVLDAPPRYMQASTSPATAEASAAAECGGAKMAAHRAPFDPVTPPPLPKSSTSWLEDNTLTMLELCATQLELFWTLPAPTLAQCCQLAAPTRAALELLQESTASHTSARALLECMLRPVKLAADPLAEHNRLGNAGTPFNDAASASQGLFAFSAAATPVSSSHMTRTASPWAPDFTPSPDEPQQRNGHTEVYCPALSYMQLAWMRRHHTHALLRGLLLMVTLNCGQGQGQRPVSTDRLILAQHNHSVTGVHFDASSCDSVVWTTESGTSVGHGFRELLAGDNEEALWKQATERNLATAAFTLGLTAQHERLRLAAEHAEQQYTPAVIAAVAAKSALESRPRLGEAANAMPSSHPHLPFFVSRHLDGHLDLYPFASQECVASFRCAARHGQSAMGRSGGVGTSHSSACVWRAWGVAAGPTAAVPAHSARLACSAVGAAVSSSLDRDDGYAVTPVAFSPNGYIVAAGLSDGSVAGWRFAAAAVESPPAFSFPPLFTPSGIRSCTFCGDRSSLMVVVGVAKEPHQYRHGYATADSTSSLGISAATPLSALAPPLVPSSVAAAPASASTTWPSTAASFDAGEMVGEMLILDTMLGAGAITARCALPFIPSYAVYIASLRAVLMVSLEGMLATYAVATGRLAVLGTVPVTTVLRSALGPSLGADCGDAGAGAASSRSGATDSDTVYITCVARSSYDPLVALGVSNGLVLLLHFRSISAAMARTERRIRDEGEDTFVYYPPRAFSAGSDTTESRRSKRKVAQQTKSGAVASASATARVTSEVAAPAMGKEFLARLPEKTVLSEATYMQVAPHINTRSAIVDLVFSPSMLLAGLQDGKVMAASLIAHATRARLTAGCTIPSDLLECP